MEIFIVNLVDGAVLASKSGSLRSGNIFCIFRARYCDQVPSARRNVVAAQRFAISSSSSLDGCGRWPRGRYSTFADHAKSKNNGKEIRGCELCDGRCTRWGRERYRPPVIRSNISPMFTINEFSMRGISIQRSDGERTCRPGESTFRIVR